MSNTSSYSDGSATALGALAAPRSAGRKNVHFGSIDPALIALVKRVVRPTVVAIILALGPLVYGQPVTLPVLALAILSFFVAAQFFRPLSLRHAGVREMLKAAPRLFGEWLCVVAVLYFPAVALKLTLEIPDRLIFDWFLLTPFALLGIEVVSAPVVRRLAAARGPAHRCVIIGANDIGVELSHRLSETQGGGELVAFFDYRTLERLGSVQPHRLITNCKAGDLASFVRDNQITHVYIALPMAATPRIAELVEELRDTTASVYFVPHVFAFDLVHARCVEISGMPAFSIYDSPLHGLNGLRKRLFDIGLAVITLVLTWPLFLLIGLLVKLSSPGPMLFKQRRYGLHGEQIRVYKFRSMRTCEDGAVIRQATAADPRTTRIGRFLRRTSLDELPQVFNVLEGTMSFVGPRPHAVAHNEEYRRLISGYMIRHKVRPGITGWAQVHGLRGETATVERMRQRVQFDLDYLNNWSLWLDVKIIAKTLRIVLGGANAY